MRTKNEKLKNIIRDLTSLPKLYVWALVIVTMVACFVSIISSRFTDHFFTENSNSKFPTDDEMQTIFSKNRPTFEKLIQMSNEDFKVIWITNDYTEVLGANRSGEMGKDRPIGFSMERWKEYKQLFKDIGLETGVARLGRDGGIYIEGTYLIAVSEGMLEGKEKGYVYTTKNIDEKLMVDSLDEVFKNIDEKKITISQKYAIFYKKIAENWYMYIEMD